MKALAWLLVATIGLAAVGAATHAKTPGGEPLLVLIAGPPSHGPGFHEFNAGVLLFAKCLNEGPARQAKVRAYHNGEWPEAAELGQADTILIYADGGDKHPALQGGRLAQLGAQMKRGCGFICLHFALEVPPEKGGREFREWLGGYFEVGWSINPRWAANIVELPQHPIRNGVRPFIIDDELYYHMKFKEGMAGVTPILSALPPEKSVSSKDSARGGNAAVRAEVASRMPQHVAWAVERPDGGRGFGFTAGHTHRWWMNDDQRKVVLNALLWTAKIDVPPKGVQSTVTESDVTANLDAKGRGAPQARTSAPDSPPAIAKGVEAPPTAAPTGQRSFTTPTAVTAQQRFVESSTKARRALVEDLEAALKSAMTSGDLDEANAINEAKKLAGAGGNPPAGTVFKSLRANEGRARFEKAIAAAQKRYAEELQGAVKTVLAAGKLDEANALNAELKALGVVTPPPGGSGPFPQPLGAATAGRKAQGLLVTRYPIHPQQADGKRDGAYVPYTELGKPIGSARTVTSISPWEKPVDENAVAAGFIRIDRPGTYEFHSKSDWDRNELWIDRTVVCRYRDGRDNKHAVELRAGLLPIVSVGYAHATKAVTVEWRPPGQAEWSGIPSALLSH